MKKQSKRLTDEIAERKFPSIHKPLWWEVLPTEQMKELEEVRRDYHAGRYDTTAAKIAEFLVGRCNLKVGWETVARWLRKKP